MIYRNKKILALAKEVPFCSSCGKVNDGTVVACHSNRIIDGKGMGIKAQDFRIFYGCMECHAAYDSGHLSREQKEKLFEDAHRLTIGWLFTSGHLKVV